jgi:hypothetical protein
MLRIAATAAAVAAGALAQSALGGHYHTYNNITHGLVHGDSKVDGAFFSRTYGFYFGGVNVCAVGDYDRGAYASAYSYNADLCSLWSYHYAREPDECRGFSYNRVGQYGGDPDAYVSGHYHSAHDPPYYRCRVSAA